MKLIKKHLTLFLIGAGIYFELELHWRYFTGHLPVHWSMPLLGAFLFVLIGGLNNWLPWEMPLLQQAGIGMCAVTAAEFIAGCILNLWLGLGIWDYSHLPFNLMGQICLPFMGAWFVLAVVAIVADDFLRWKLFDEPFPHYRL